MVERTINVPDKKGVRNNSGEMRSRKPAPEEIRVEMIAEDSDGADVTRCRKLFHRRSVATGKARSPTVDGRVHRMIRGRTLAMRALKCDANTCCVSPIANPLSSDRQHLSYDVCLEATGEIIRTVLCCIVVY